LLTAHMTGESASKVKCQVKVKTKVKVKSNGGCAPRTKPGTLQLPMTAATPWTQRTAGRPWAWRRRSCSRRTLPRGRPEI